MKYTVTYSCGHTGTVQLYGKTEERERKIKYYEEYGLCPECYKKQKQEEKEKLEQKSRFEEMLAAQILFKKQHGKELQKQKEREAKLADLLKEEPDLIKGKRWNQKIYGKSGNYSIYPDGEKVNISDEEAEELKKYLKDFREKMKEEAGID